MAWIQAPPSEDEDKMAAARYLESRLGGSYQLSTSSAQRSFRQPSIVPPLSISLGIAVQARSARHCGLVERYRGGWLPLSCYRPRSPCVALVASARVLSRYLCGNAAAICPPQRSHHPPAAPERERACTCMESRCAPSRSLIVAPTYIWSTPGPSRAPLILSPPHSTHAL